MKKNLLFGCLAVFQAGLIYAQDRDILFLSPIATIESNIKLDHPKQVSSQTQSNFETLFPKATDVVYSAGSKFDEAYFKTDGEWHRAFFDWDGNLVAETTDEPQTALPAKSDHQIAERFPGYQVKQVVKFKDEETSDADDWIYGEDIDNDIAYFAKLEKDNHDIIVEISSNGDVSFFEKYPSKG